MRLFWIILGLAAIVVALLVWRGPEEPAATRSAPDHDRDGDGGTRHSVAVMPPDPAMSEADLVADLMSSRGAPPGLASSLPEIDASAPAARINTETQAGAARHNPNPAAPREYAPVVGATTDSSIITQPDGSLLVDSRFVVRGNGTAGDPYQVPWELLVSASETYQPRLGMTELPERVKMLNGKYIKISGYLAFPLAQRESDEVLVMLNMWDGCCIGVPPSPYDALETKLAEPLDMNAHRFINFGTLTGVLKVDPYIDNEWLLGLYVVEEGRLDFGL